MTNPVLEGIEHLEPLPATVARLVPALANEKTTAADVADILENDPALAANVLRAANSSLYGGRFEIRRIRDAVVRLGLETILQMALGPHLATMAVPAGVYDLGEDELLLHAALVSWAAGEIGRRCPGAGIPSSAGLAGLLHDLGKLLMARYLDADAGEVRSLAEREGIPFVEAERRLFGTDHAEVGGKMAEKWGVPEEIVLAIREHHADRLPEDHPVLDAVVLGNYVAKTVGIGLGAEGMNFRVDPACRDRVGLGEEAFELLCADAALRLEELRDAYGLSPTSPVG